jgi:putative tricarboxylic transport membrane protein
MSRSVERWKGDAACGVALAIVGGTVIWLSRATPLGSAGQPGPGFMPVALSAGLIALGIGCAARAWIARAGSERTDFAETGALAVVAALAAAILLLEPIGFLPVSVLFLTVLFKALGKDSSLACTALGVAIGGGSWLVFDKLLGVQLPAGLVPL